MPRRPTPVAPIAIAVFNAGEIARLRRRLNVVVRGEPSLKRLPIKTRRVIKDDFANAVGYARVGLRDIMSGKRAKPDAWAADILVKDVCDALHAAGVQPVMRPQQIFSVAQGLARKLGIIAGLPMRGELFHQMQRARWIEKKRYRCVRLLGRWEIFESR